MSTLNSFQAWQKSPDSLIIQAEQTFDCCGLGVMENGTVYLTPNEADIKWSIDHKVFDNYPSAKCHHDAKGTTRPDCQTCFSLITDKVPNAHPPEVFYIFQQPQVNSGFNGAGGLGLFFSFSEVCFILSRNYELVLGFNQDVQV